MLMLFKLGSNGLEYSWLWEDFADVSLELRRVYPGGFCPCENNGCYRVREQVKNTLNSTQGTCWPA